MTDFLDQLEHDLVDAARRRGIARRVADVARRRAAGGPLTVVIAIAVTGATAAAAGTFTALRGSPIPGPLARDAGPDQRAAPGTARVTAVRSADPAGGAPWTLRLAASPSGLTCTTVGQEVDGAFGLVGLEGRFRPFSEGVDGCGDAARGPIAGARVFDAPNRKDVRTVVYGLAGPKLSGVRVFTATGSQNVPVGPGGTFVKALRGYPEDLGLRAQLTLPGGRRDITLGASDDLIPDGAGGPAWKASVFAVSNQPQTCVQLRLARQRQDGPISPGACGITQRNGQRPAGYWFAVRRIEPTGCGQFSFARGRWCHFGARTAVWGSAGQDVRSVKVLGAPGGPVVAPIGKGRGTGVVLPASVDPAALTVLVTLAGGRSRRLHGDTNLVPPPKEP